MFIKWNLVSDNIEVEATKDISKDELDVFNNVLEKMIKNLK